jgi:hypothetical protein
MTQAMSFDFVLRGLRGSVSVTLAPNDDPVVLGCRPTGRGFPVCTAHVTYEGRGYDAIFGWIQLVRSTDNASAGREFEMDPYEPLGDLPHPFCWIGLTPTLFDAPSRATLVDLKWVGHSFLCFVPEASDARAVLGFSWGFDIDDGEISFHDIAPVTATEWDDHLPLLRREYPTWRFADGFRNG